MTEEKKELIVELEKNQSQLHTTLSTVSEELFCHQPSEDRWSIAELVEHIILVEKGVLKSIKKYGAKPRSEKIVSALDKDQVRKVANNRARKIKAPDLFIPKGIFKNKAAAIEAFNQHRSEVGDFITTTTLPLHSIGFPHMVIGMLNGMSWFSFMASHCHRHILQIEELKENY